MEELQQKIKLLNQLCNEYPNNVRDNTYLVIEFPNTEIAKTHLAILNGYNNLKFEQVHATVRIELTQTNTSIFISKEDFLNRVRSKDIANGVNIAILNKDNDYLLYFGDQQEARNSGGIISSNLISNAFYYLALIDLLSILQDTEHPLIDYHDSVNRQFILTSATKGKIILGYQRSIPDFEVLPSFKDYWEIINLILADKIRTSYFKNELFNFLSLESVDKRIEFLFRKFDLIYESAERNFDVYLFSFSFDDAKNKYTEKKFSYYDGFRTIMNRLTTQIASVPLAISVTGFFSYKSINDPVVLFLIIIGFCLYILFFLISLLNTKREVKEYANEICSSYEKLKSEPFLIKHKTELGMFETDRSILDQKALRAVVLIDTIIFLTILISIVFILFLIPRNILTYIIERL